jgi:hypothetical protein
LHDFLKRKNDIIGFIRRNTVMIQATYKYQRPVRLAYQPPASSTFLSQQTSHQQPANSTLLSEQINTSHQPTEQAANMNL